MAAARRVWYATLLTETMRRRLVDMVVLCRRHRIDFESVLATATPEH